MKLLSGLAIVAYAQSGDGSAETAVDVPASESVAPAFRQRAISSGGNSDYEYYYEQSALGRRKKKKKKKIIFNIRPQPTTTRAPPTTTRAPLPAISNDYSMLFGENGSFGSKVSSDYNDYSGGSSGFANSASDRWSGFGGSDYAYDYQDGFGEITVGNTFNNSGKGNFEFSAMGVTGSSPSTGYNGLPVCAADNSNAGACNPVTNFYFNESDNTQGDWEVSQNQYRWDNDDINKYWEFMHRQWGHQQENRRSKDFAYDPVTFSQVTPSRWYHVGPERVINNLNRGYLNYQFPSADGKGDPSQIHFKFPVDRRGFMQAGRHGYPWGQVPGKKWELAVESYGGTTGGASSASNGDGVTSGGSGTNKFGWYAQPWLWDAENVPGANEYNLWNAAGFGDRAVIGNENLTGLPSGTTIDTDAQTAITHTFGFIDWRDQDQNSFPNSGEVGIIPGTAGTDTSEANGTRFQDVSPARAPWLGRYFDASWELGDSPAHFVADGIYTDGKGHIPFDFDFSDEDITVEYITKDGSGNNNLLPQSNGDNTQPGWQRYYSGYRWFPGIANFPGTHNDYTHASGRSVAGTAGAHHTFTNNMHGIGARAEDTNQVNDPSKLKCHHCIEQAHLEWDNDYHTFKLVSLTTIGSKHYNVRDDLSAAYFSADDSTDNTDAITESTNDAAHSQGVDLWKQCFDTLKQRSCEYSSGVCYVEERRVWGYVTQVQAGCQQSQACYMQKYQNFVVEAGRQCWPGDAFAEQHRLATRPDDMRADQWIYNIIKGGLMLAQKPMRQTSTVNDHRFRKFPSHYFSEMENDATATISQYSRLGTEARSDGALKGRILDGNGTAAAAGPPVVVAARGNLLDDFREENNWIDKFNTDFTAHLDSNPNSTTPDSMKFLATHTDGNYGVGRSGYESAFKHYLQYPSFLSSKVGSLGRNIYRGGFDSTDGAPDATYVPADIAHENPVYGMKMSDEIVDEEDRNNVGQQYDGTDLVPAEGQTSGADGDDTDLDFNGAGAADAALFAERGQFYQNEASRFAATADVWAIDDQWRNPDQHNYIQNAGMTSDGADTTEGTDTGIYRRYNRPTWSDGDLADTLTNIIENNVSRSEGTRYQPIEYKNGLVEASKCHQCCNTDHNCNWNWQPTTKLDWNFAYVWRYAGINERSNEVDAAGTDSTGSMGEANNERAWDTAIRTLSQVHGDHHFSFPPYMANHPVNRGNGNSNGGDPTGTSTNISTPQGTSSGQTDVTTWDNDHFNIAYTSR